jgi:hypothetical protein
MVIPEIDTDGDCKLCHIDGGPIGDLGSPHHRSDLADSDQCNECHLEVVETNSVEPPGHLPNFTTPTPYACENCHWPSGLNPHEATTLDGNAEKFFTDWQSWQGKPKPTISLYGYNPQPIEANGPFLLNWTLGKKPYMPTSGTHHKVGGKVFQKCYNCHASAPYTEPDWDPTNPYLIRYCENCHSMDKLHSINEHVTTNNLYTVGGLRNQTVTAIEKCAACHCNCNCDPLQQEFPEIIADVPVIDRLEPNFGPQGVVVDIIPLSGQCWTKDPVDGLCSFGIKMTGDAVKIGQKDTEGNWYWVDAPIYSWSKHLIQIKVPGGTFQPGKTRIKLYKETLGISNSKVFNIRKHPIIYSLTPSVGNLGQFIDIGGEGFGMKQEKVYQNGYGYSTYVELYGLTETYRATRYRRHKFWDPYKIPIRLKDLFDINNIGNPVSEQDLYEGLWNLKVITDYFKDDGDSKYNYGLSGLDTPTNPQGTGSGDELLYRVISDPVCFRVTKDPYINSISPDPAPYANKAEILGSNFGQTQDTSVVKVWNKKKTNFKIAKVRAWSNNKIKFVVPRFGTNPAKYPVKRWIQVEVPGKPVSNYYLLTITAPGP